MMPSVLVLKDVHVHAAERGFAYGLVHMLQKSARCLPRPVKVSLFAAEA